jgi:hypothetical protein|eukprot:COSAG01_NODE_5363_length_4309_cov_5.219240_2_plen_120_part_00
MGDVVVKNYNHIFAKVFFTGGPDLTVIAWPPSACPARLAERNPWHHDLSLRHESSRSEDSDKTRHSERPLAERQCGAAASKALRAAPQAHGSDEGMRHVAERGTLIPTIPRSSGSMATL